MSLIRDLQGSTDPLSGTIVARSIDALAALRPLGSISPIRSFPSIPVLLVALAR